jgi:hypothetical protein
MSEPLRRAIVESGVAFLKIEHDTGIARASISRFVAGRRSLRLDLADRLAAYFGLELRRKRVGGEEMVSALVIPVSKTQIEAAGRLYQEHLSQWRLVDSCFRLLRERVPDFSAEACLLKVAAVNELYRTNVYAVVRMAEHVQRVLADQEPETAGPELVETLAALNPTKNQAPRRHFSFASKFAHFFIEPDRYPILDSFAVRRLKFHLGKKCYSNDVEHPYLAFVRNLNELKKLSGFSGENKALDCYLWLSGQYKKWVKNPKAEVASESRKLFQIKTGEVVHLCRSLLAECEYPKS